MMEALLSRRYVGCPLEISMTLSAQEIQINTVFCAVYTLFGLFGLALVSSYL